MIYSKTSEYAIRALIYFADHPEEASANVAAVSKESGVPKAYVAKIFQFLVKGGILKSRRGPKGGFSLAVPVRKLTLLRVIQSVDDLSKSSFSNCIMGLDKCSDKEPCPLHPVWAAAKEKMLGELAATTVADIAELGNKFRAGRRRRMVLSKGMRKIFSF